MLPLKKSVPANPYGFLTEGEGGGGCYAFQALWPDIDAADVSDQAADSLVHPIRERLRSASASKDFIATVKGQGFRLEL